MREILDQIRQCTMCTSELPLPPRPILQGDVGARIVIIGQAPGYQAHHNNLPFSDASGDRLRAWLGINTDTFYNPQRVAILPMSFCYPGKGKGGDKPPIKRCASVWHKQFLEHLNGPLKILVGQYAQQFYLQDKCSLTTRLQNWQHYLPDSLVLPHPSPRNNIWLAKHSWFEQDVLPKIRQKVTQALL